jgi:hypothetical protein
VTTWLKYNYETPDYSDFIHAALVTSVKGLNTQSQNLLRLYYGQKLDINVISKQLCLAPNIVNELLYQTSSELENALLKELDVITKRFLNIWLNKQYKYTKKGNLNSQPEQLILK